MNKSSLIKVLGIITLLNIFSKLFGIIKDSIYAKEFGISHLTDSYSIALTIPTFFYSIVGVSAMTIFIPIFKEKINKEGLNSANKFANTIITIMILFMSIISLIIYFESDSIAKLFAPNFSENTLQLTSNLIKITSFNIIFMILTNIFCGILQAQNEFLSSSLTGFMLSIPLISYLLFVNNKNIYMLTIITCLGFSLQFILQIPFLIKNKFEFKLNFDIKNPHVYQIGLSMIPIMLGIAVDQLSVMVDKIMGSYLQQGTITSVDFASKINMVLYSIFGGTAITIMYPQFSEDAINKKYDSFLINVGKSILLLNSIIIPLGVLIFILREDIISVIYQRGNFDVNANKNTSIALACFCLGLPFVSIRDLAARAFYAIKDTKTPGVTGIISILINIALNIILTPFLGIIGITISTSISLMISSILLMIILKKKFIMFKIKDLFLELCKVLMCAMIMGTVLFVLNIYISPINNIYKLVKIVLVSFTGLSVYIVCLYIFKVKEVKSIISLITSKFGKGAVI